jgi:hypothetical protein
VTRSIQQRCVSNRIFMRFSACRTQLARLCGRCLAVMPKRCLPKTASTGNFDCRNSVRSRVETKFLGLRLRVFFLFKARPFRFVFGFNFSLHFMEVPQSVPKSRPPPPPQPRTGGVGALHSGRESSGHRDRSYWERRYVKCWQ